MKISTLFSIYTKGKGKEKYEVRYVIGNYDGVERPQMQKWKYIATKLISKLMR